MLHTCLKRAMHALVNSCNSPYSILYFPLACKNSTLSFLVKYYPADTVYEENFLILYPFTEENICFKVNDPNFKKIESEENQ